MVASINSPAQAVSSVVSSIDLIAIAKQFRSDPQQIKLIQWLQASTGQQRQAEFAQMWRNGEEKGTIDFVQVFRFYQGRPHQNAALKWLQQTSQPKTLEGFACMWGRIPAAGKNRELRLNVPYYEQTNNLYEPQRTCNTSSCAMVARFLGAKISGDDAYYQIVRKYGDTTDHGAQTKALAQVGIKSTWNTNLGYDDLDRSLEAGLPIVIGILHRGTLQSPTGGHMIVVVGRTPSHGYICHDPYGSLLDPNGGYTGAVENGKGVVYPRFVLNHRWLVEGEQSGWGRLFYAHKAVS
ncbi:C39 family peptidase [Leptolyngbya sp. GB1-A1]|uniref:C39 family peptidase n=1 Tax=Leptolyngbya sp. GB1-A1 TaxID=2933908 RepID=UPI0032991311